MAFTGSVQQASTQQPAPGVGADPQTQTPAAAPSFRDAVAATTQQQQDRLDALTAAANGEGAPAAPAPAAQPGISTAQQTALEGAIGEMSQEQFDAWYKAQPEGALKRAAANIASHFEQGIRQKYGDLLQLGDLADADPAVKKKFERLAKDPKAREFILGTAFSIMDPGEFGNAQAPPQDAQQYSRPATTEDVNAAVDARLTQERTRIALEAERTREMEALLREVPTLNWTQGTPEEQSRTAKKVAHIIDIAEKRSNYASGVRVSYREVADELGMLESRVAPQSVPQTSSTQAPPAAQLQAPKNELEVRQRMTQTLNRYGSLMDLAASLPQRI